VRTLSRGIEEAGSHSLSFRTREAGGRALGAGVYLLRITAGSEQRTVRAVVFE
jgi:hypothetical protein